MTWSKIVRFSIIFLLPIILLGITYKVSVNHHGEFKFSDNWEIWAVYILITLYIEYRLITGTSRD